MLGAQSFQDLAKVVAGKLAEQVAGEEGALNRLAFWWVGLGGDALGGRAVRLAGRRAAARAGVCQLCQIAAWRRSRG